MARPFADEDLTGSTGVGGLLLETQGLAEVHEDVVVPLDNVDRRLGFLNPRQGRQRLTHRGHAFRGVNF